MDEMQILEAVGEPGSVRMNGPELQLAYDEGFVVLRDGTFSHFHLYEDPAYEVLIDAFSAENGKIGQRVVVLPADKEISASDLAFREYAAYVKRLLAQKGYVVADDIGGTIDQAIFLTYGISEPHSTTQSFTVPVYGMVNSGGTQTLSTQGTVSNYGSGYSSGNYYGTGTVYTPPQYGVVGTEVRHVTTTFYVRYLKLESVDFRAYRKSKSIDPLWRTTIVSAGSSGDLRRTLPMLVLAAYDNIDVQSREQIKWVVSERDPRLAVISGQGQSARRPASKRKGK